MSRMCDKLMYSNVTPRGAVSSTAESLLRLHRLRAESATGIFGLWWYVFHRHLDAQPH